MKLIYKSCPNGVYNVNITQLIAFEVTYFPMINLTYKISSLI